MKPIDELKHQIGIYELGIRTEFWQELSKEIKLLFDNSLVELRKASRKTTQDDKIRGKLDAYEEIRQLPEKIIGRKNVV